MSEEQGQEAEVVENTEAQEKSESLKAETESEKVQAEPTEGEPEEINYQEAYEKAKAASEREAQKIGRQRAAITQHEEKIKELNKRLMEYEQAQKPQEIVKPDINDYKTTEDYDAAVEEYVKNKAQKLADDKAQEAIQAQKHAQMQAMAQAQEAAFLKSEAEFKASNPDYDRAKNEVADFTKTNPLPPQVLNVVLEQAAADGMLPAVVNYFGENSGERLSELGKIGDLSPREAIIEIYKIQQSLKKSPKQIEKPLPKPLKSVKGTGTNKGLGKHSSGDDVLKTLGLK